MLLLKCQQLFSATTILQKCQNSKQLSYIYIYYSDLRHASVTLAKTTARECKFTDRRYVMLFNKVLTRTPTKELLDSLGHISRVKRAFSAHNPPSRDTCRYFLNIFKILACAHPVEHFISFVHPHLYIHRPVSDFLLSCVNFAHIFNFD